MRSRCLAEREERLVVAVSGGLDSLVLLRVLHLLAPAHGWQLVVAHFNHRLRGAESDGDEAFVRRVAKRLKWPVIVEAADVRRFAKERKESIELAARDLRHAFLARTARSVGARKITLAHHADDQTETVFLRLLRGSGGVGLTGMGFASPSPADASLTLIRPLLGIGRVEMERFARARRIRFREDRTNREIAFPRNLLRHRVLPLLRERVQPALNAVIQRTVDLLGAEADFVSVAAREWSNARERPPFQGLHVAVQRRLLANQLQALGLPVSFELVESLRQHPFVPLMPEADRQVWRDATGVVRLGTVFRPEFDPEEREFELRGDRGELRFAGLGVAWQIEESRSILKYSPPRPGCEYFDAERVGGRICLRHWQPGDRFQPLGMGAPTKLQDFFTKQKVPRALRHNLVLAEIRPGAVFWVEGLRIAEPFKVTAKTRRWLRWTWQRMTEIETHGARFGRTGFDKASRSY